MSTIFPTTVPSKRLSASITGSSMSFQLNNIKGWDGNNLTSADFGTKAYGVFRNPENTILELFEFDPSTIASGSITILLRGLKFTGDLTTEVSANKLTWVRNETIVELGADVPQLLKHFVDDLGNQTIAGIKTFSSLPATTAGDPIDDNDLARKAYVESVVAGSYPANRIVVAGTAGATIAEGNLIYLDSSDGEWKLCDADTAASVENVLLGIAQGAGTDGNAITNGVLIRGYDDNQTGLTANNVYYASNTAGGIANSAGTTEVTIGFSLSTTEIYFSPGFNQHITEDEQDAMAGTSGTPSASNKFVTADDVSAAAASGKIVRATGTALPALDGSNLTGISLFGGDGSDGALTISSGTTTIDCSNAPVVVKNYSSINITGTGVLAFSNPHTNGTIVIIKCNGDVTLTSSATPMIDMSGMGGQGGAGGASQSAGSAGRTMFAPFLSASGALGIDGGAGGTTSAGTAAVGQNSNDPDVVARSLIDAGLPFLVCGGGGGGGGDGNSGGVGGAGGAGGGALMIECKGAWNFTTGSVSVGGDNGSDGTLSSDGGGGGGGGAGGTFIALYGTVTANTGTVTKSGGTGGTGNGDSTQNGGAGGNGSSGSGNAGQGGDGAQNGGANSSGGAGGSGGAYLFGTTNGSNGTDASSGGGAGDGGGGGGGASGYSYIGAKVMN